MPEALKNKYYNYDMLHGLALRIQEVYSPFQAEDFIRDILDETWDALELKARTRRISIRLGKYLPSDYEQALSVIDKVVAGYPEGFLDYAFVFFPDFVEVYGQDDRYWNLSIAALERYTKFSSSEFAVRPFIQKDRERMMRQMAVWARHENEHVRRLASEGCRPQLPWGQVLTDFIKDPSPILCVLEQLKADSSPYVRKSVANNLNDISQTHPDLVAKLARDWYGKNEHTDWIVKHGCRTLLKQGNRAVLDIFGFANADHVKVDGFALCAPSIRMGEDIAFTFAIEAERTVKVRLEYGIDYRKANGKRSRKIFQISEFLLQEHSRKTYVKTHSFADTSTRKHYPGTHSVALIVNGVEHGTLDFELLAAE